MLKNDHICIARWARWNAIDVLWIFSFPLTMPMSCLKDMLALLTLAKLVCLATTGVVIFVVVLIFMRMLIKHYKVFAYFPFPVLIGFAMVTSLYCVVRHYLFLGYIL